MKDNDFVKIIRMREEAIKYKEQMEKRYID